jgi:hypothetical protein
MKTHFGSNVPAKEKTFPVGSGLSGREVANESRSSTFLHHDSENSR